MDEKRGQLNNESKGKVLSAPDNAQESANGTTMNALRLWYNKWDALGDTIEGESVYPKCHFKNEIQNFIVRFCFYLNMTNEIQILDYHFHV